MNGRAVAPGAGTVLNALATGTGSAFAIDLETTASVELAASGPISGEITGAPAADTSLIEHCVAATLERYGDSAEVEADLGPDPTAAGATVTTTSDVPMASGLKSSSAAANATVLATLDALGLAAVDRLAACRLGVEAARSAGVTVTGAFDDASASMLGGVTVTDNGADELLAHETPAWQAAVYTPPEQAYSADADVDACRKITDTAEVVAELALEGRFTEAMTINGFAFCGALGHSPEPMLEALPDADGVSLSGTGPSTVAVGNREALERVRDSWNERPGTTRLVDVRTDGARTL